MIKKKDLLRALIIFIVFVLCFIFASVFDSYIMSKHKTTCAKVVKIKYDRGYKLDLEYNVKGKTIVTMRPLTSRNRRISIDSISNMECVEIIYSTIWNNRIRIVDRRIKSNWTWWDY